MDVVAAFEEVRAYLSRFNALDFLSQFSMTYLFTPEDQFVSESDDVHIRSRELEFASGFYATQPLNSDGEQVDESKLEEFRKLSDAYFTAVDASLLSDTINGKRTLSSPMVSARIHSLHVRGDAYPHQFWYLAEAIYTPHTEWFRNHLGFAIADAITIARSIELELNNRFALSLENSKQRAESLVKEQASDWKAAGMTKDQALTSASVQLSFWQSKALYRFTLQEVASISGLAEEVCSAFFARLSQRPPYRNSLFPNTFTDPLHALWDYNTVKERPFFTDGEAFWVFAPHTLKEVLYSTFFFDLMGDQSYRGTFENGRGKVLEELSASFLKRAFPPESVILNPSYPNGEEFADVCVIHDSKLVIVQCKSKGLTLAAYTGDDEEALKRDLQKAIGNAAAQACKGRKYLETESEPYLLCEGKKVVIDRSLVNEICLIAVTFMPLHAFATRVRDVEADLNIPHAEFPVWAVPVGDLDLVTEIQQSPAKLLHYIRRRLLLEMGEKKVHADEMDLLAFYLDQGLWLTGDDMTEANLIGLSGYSTCIDEFVFNRYERGIETPLPRAARPDGFDALIENIESLSTLHRTDCALALLELSGEASEAVMGLIQRTKQRCLERNETITSSMGCDEPAWGMSIVASPATLSKEDGLDRAEAFGRLKKYAERVDKWGALGWRIGSPNVIDSAIWLDYPFEQDAKTDALVSMVFKKS
ncbi:MAG: hypothetical protein CXZ00_06075 [Acidobacteria bacterium]|nr:MAG: hypothetical protein CXZ00_06075 [Acidobacteriota bacterium]